MESVSEVLDDPFKLRWSQKLSGSLMANTVAEFKTDGRPPGKFRILFKHVDEHDHWSVAFGFPIPGTSDRVLAKRPDLRGKPEGEKTSNDYQRVLATVVEAMRVFLEKVKPDLIVFVPSDDKLEFLYKAIIKRKLAGTGYEFLGGYPEMKIARIKTHSGYGAPLVKRVDQAMHGH